jgi:hypothetical protein
VYFCSKIVALTLRVFRGILLSFFLRQPAKNLYHRTRSKRTTTCAFAPRALRTCTERMQRAGPLLHVCPGGRRPTRTEMRQNIIRCRHLSTQMGALTEQESKLLSLSLLQVRSSHEKLNFFHFIDISVGIAGFLAHGVLSYLVLLFLGSRASQIWKSY